MTPVTRFPLRVHDRNDEDEVVLDGVEHRVREHACEAAPNVVFENFPADRRAEGPCNGGTNLHGETASQTVPARLVEFDGFRDSNSASGWNACFTGPANVQSGDKPRQRGRA